MTELSHLIQFTDGAERRRVVALARILRQQQRRAGDGSEIGGTPFTVLKLANNPIGRLVDAGAIGAEELRAAGDICLAFFTLTGSLQVKPPTLERIDKHRGADSGRDAREVSEAQQRWKRFAAFWSPRAKRGDPTLAIVVAAIIDEHPFDQIEDDLGLSRRNGVARKSLVRALRHYAAIGGWCDLSTATLWISQATDGFRLRTNTKRETVGP